MLRRDLSLGVLAAAAGSAYFRQSEAQTCTPPCYSTIAQESAAGVTPTNTQYLPGDVRRYGAVMNGSTDDAAAWKSLALVMAQGVDGYAPPLASMIKSQVTISVPGSSPISFFGYGCTIKTTGAISALEVTGGGSLGRLSVYGLTHDNTTDGLASFGFLGYNCNHCNFIDCNIIIPSTIHSSGSYSGVCFQTNSGAYGFWNSVVRLMTRQASGSSTYYAPFGVLLSGACNATWIRDCTLTSVSYGVGMYNTSTSAIANAVVIDGCAFEGCVNGILVYGGEQSGSSVTLSGLRVTNNRAESLTAGFMLYDYLGAESANPTFLAGNFIESTALPYLSQNNGGLEVSVNSFDPPYQTVLRNVTGVSTTGTAANNVRGSVTISGTATSAIVTFPTKETDTNFFITLGARTASGVPAVGALRASYSSPATTGFTIDIEAAPGGTASVTVNWLLTR